MALGRVSDLSESTCDFTMGHSGGDNTKTKVLREAAEIVNDLIHEEICSEDWQSNPKFFNITNEIRKINPSLWHFIECATRSTRERMSTRTREENTFIQKCRRLFFLFLFLHSVQIPSLYQRILFYQDSSKILRMRERLVPGPYLSPSAHRARKRAWVRG